MSIALDNVALFKIPSNSGERIICVHNLIDKTSRGRDRLIGEVGNFEELMS